MLLVYIAAGVVESSIFASALGSGDASAVLAGLSERAGLIHLSTALSLLTIVSALVLAVALFAITRHYDLELAVFALCGRAAEAVIGAFYVLPALSMLAVAEVSVPADNAASLFALLSSMRAGAMLLSATCFAVGSAVFSYLFLRARSVPGPLAWLGVGASILLLVVLPIQLAVGGRATTWLVWLPMLVFEIVLALWLLVRGVAPDPAMEPRQRVS